jgi:hypothetical protein
VVLAHPHSNVADPLVVLVFVVSAGPVEPAGSAMTSATRRALGRDAVVLVEQRSELPTLDEAQSLGEREHAAAVVEVDWHDADRTHATVRVHVVRRSGWALRDFTFLPADPLDERGRTIGFAMASLIDSGDGLAEGAASPERSLSRGDHPPDERRSSWLMIDAAGVGTLGSEAGTTSGGVEVAGLALFHPRLAGVISAGTRFGDIAGAQSTFWSIQLGCGAAWRAMVFPTRCPFELDLRADVLATFLRAARQGETQSAWQPGARLGVEAAWFPLGPSLGFIALAGGEAAFGSASVVVGSRMVATVSPWRGVGEHGLRSRF